MTDLEQRIREDFESQCEQYGKCPDLEVDAEHWYRLGFRAALPRWIPVSERLPKAGKKVSATFKNYLGKRRTIYAFYAPRWTVESDPDGEAYDEYSEEKDAYFLREGWYETIENWGDFSSVHVCEGEVTHWMPLPLAPSTDS